MSAPRPPDGRFAAADAIARAAPLAFRWMERLLAAHGPPLSVVQYEALAAIAEGPLAAVELARRAGVSPPAASQLVAALAELGLVERLPDAADRRRRELRLSGEGERTLRSARSLLRQRFAEILDELPPREAATLARALARLGAVLGATPPPRRPPPPGPPRPPRR